MPAPDLKNLIQEPPVLSGVTLKVRFGRMAHEVPLMEAMCIIVAENPAIVALVDGKVDIGEGVGDNPPGLILRPPFVDERRLTRPFEKVAVMEDLWWVSGIRRLFVRPPSQWLVEAPAAAISRCVFELAFPHALSEVGGVGVALLLFCGAEGALFAAADALMCRHALEEKLGC